MFSLFSPNTAGNYAASFRQVEPVPGFSNVKESRFSEMLANLPVEKYKQEMAFARDALGEVAATRRANDQLDYYRERDALADRQSRISNLLNLVGGTGAQVARIAVPERRNSYDTLLGVARTEDALGVSRANRMAGSTGGLTEALKGLGPLPSLDSKATGVDASSLFQSTPTYAPPQPGSLADVAKTTSNMELFEQFLKQTGGK
jgi:hypothetical protein